MVSVDLTFIYQIIGYFILLYLMNTLLYKPLVAIMKERDKKTTETEGGAKATHEEIETGLIDYEANLKEAAAQGQLERAKTKQIATLEEKKLTDAARVEAVAELDKICEEISKAKDSAMETLTKDAKSLSKTLAEKILSRAIPTILFLFTLTINAGEALASSDGGSSLMAWKSGMFVAILIGGYFIWTKIASPMLGKRIEDIKEALNAATKAKEDAEKELKEYKAKIEGLDKKVAEIKATIKEEADAEKTKIIEEAKKSAEKIKEQAKLTASQEIKKAKLELKNAAAKLAVELAEETLVKEIKDSDQVSLTKDYIEKITISN